MEALQKNELPKPDFKHSLTNDEIKTKYEAGDISKTAYDKWLKDKDNSAFIAWRCRYCDYKTMCKAQKETDGDL